MEPVLDAAADSPMGYRLLEVVNSLKLLTDSEHEGQCLGGGRSLGD